MQFNPLDLVWYEGELPDLKQVWKIEEIEHRPDTSYAICYRQGSLEPVAFTFNVLSKIGSIAPKFKVGDSVYKVFSEHLVETKVLEVISNEFSPPLYKLDDIDYPVLESDILPYYPTVDSSVTTLNHIQMVAKYMNLFAMTLIHRGMNHDKSKLSGLEKACLDVMEFVNKQEGNAPYGSEEYKKRTSILKPMLKHHYQNNSHHPEHYENGIYGMTLFDIVEMACDWIAAASRNGDPEVNITHSAQRFIMSDQLKRIFENTYKELGVKYK